MARQVFISHSSPRDLAGTVTEAVDEALNALPNEFTSWLDRRDIPFGSDWYARVERALADSTVGLLLLDARSAASDYVLHEATILSHRAWTQPAATFRLFVAVVDPGLTRTALGNGPLRPARLDTWQIWRASEQDAADPRCLAATLVARMSMELGNPLPRDRRGRLIERLQERLEELPARALDRAIETLEQRTGILEHALRSLLRQDGSAAGKARLVAHWMLDRAEAEPQTVCDLVDAMHDDIAPSLRPRLSRLLRIAESYWLATPVESCPVYTALQAMPAPAIKPGPSPVAINGRAVPAYTAETFAWRALGGEASFLMIRCDNGSDTTQVISAICHGLNARNPGSPMSMELARALARRLRTICVLPRGFPAGAEDTAPLNQLRTEFDSILFVVWPGEELRPDLPPEVRQIDPPVDLTQEEDRQAQWLTLQTVLGQPE